MVHWFNRLKLATRIVLLMLVVLVAVVGVNYLVFTTGYRARAQVAMVEKAKAFTAVADAAKNHASLLHQSGAFDDQALAAEMKRDLAAGKPLDQTRFFKTIPVVAGWTAAEEAAGRENIEFRITSFESRNPRHQPATGSFEEQLLRDLTAQVAAGSGDTIERVDPAMNQLHLMRAIKLNESCLVCHGEPGSRWDLDKNGMDPTGRRMEGWKAGYMHGSYHVIMPLAPIRAQVASFIFSGLLWTLPLAGLGMAAFIYLILRLIRRPMRALTERASQVAQGDLTQDIPDGLRVREDEVGELGRAMQTMAESLRQLVRNASAGIQTLGSSSTELSSLSGQMASHVKETSAKATTVAAAAEEMSANSVSVASGMEQATANLATVASSTEEMTSTIGEIAANSEKARAITAEATQQAQRVTTLTRELSTAAQAIGKVTETITAISDQTNLLALNATIEAARAGAAGKGFAVVAHEIKELARQTAEATEDIKSKVGGIQTSSTATLEDLARITQVIGQVSEIVNTIASAIEEQSAVTQDIARNVSEAVTGVKDANRRVAEISSVSQTVAKDIAGVNVAAGDLASGGEKVLTSAAELARLAEKLQRLVGQFQVASEPSAAAAAPASPLRPNPDRFLDRRSRPAGLDGDGNRGANPERSLRAESSY